MNQHISKAQQKLLEARAQLEFTFRIPTIPTELLADLARTHGMLTDSYFALQDAQAELTVIEQPTLPPIQERPKATKPKPKPESQRRNERRNLQKARQAAEKATPSPMQLADRLGVECPVCHSKRGEFCVVMTTNSQRTDRILKVGGGTHAERSDVAREAKKKGKLRPWVPPLIEESSVRAPEPSEEPARFDDGTPMDPTFQPGDNPVPFMNGTGLSDDEVLDLLDQAMPGGMILIDGVARDVDKIRQLVNGQ